MYIKMCLFICMCVFEHIYVSMYVCMHVCVCVFRYLCVCVYERTGLHRFNQAPSVQSKTDSNK